MPKEKSCTHPEEHHQHLCELAKRLARAELNALRKDARYVCANCGDKVRQGRNLCLPKKLRD
ncbi:MAG: hypothetical protein WDA20_08530 [Desulfuromonadales bacterium]